MCVCYELEPYMCFGICHAIFTRVYAMYFVINLVTSTSMQSSSGDVADFKDFEFFQVIYLMLLLCHVFMLLQSDPCLF